MPSNDNAELEVANTITTTIKLPRSGPKREEKKKKNLANQNGISTHFSKHAFTYITIFLRSYAKI